MLLIPKTKDHRAQRLSEHYWRVSVDAAETRGTEGDSKSLTITIILKQESIAAYSELWSSWYSTMIFQPSTTGLNGYQSTTGEYLLTRLEQEGGRFKKPHNHDHSGDHHTTSNGPL